MYPTAAPRASRDPDRGLEERLRLHRGREPVGREAPRAQAVGERPDGLAPAVQAQALLEAAIRVA